LCEIEFIFNTRQEPEMGRAYSTHGAKRNACRILLGKTEGNRSLGRHRCKWEDNIKMDLREVGWDMRAGFIWFRIRTSGILV
jgi:hypothetical protein